MSPRIDRGPRSEPWRLRCPNGHTSPKHRGGRLQDPRGSSAPESPYYFCEACERAYAYAVDAKTSEEVPA